MFQLKLHSVLVEVDERVFQRAGTEKSSFSTHWSLWTSVSKKWYENERVFQRECTDKSWNETAFQRCGTNVWNFNVYWVHILEDGWVFQREGMTRTVENFDTYGFEMTTAAYMRVLNSDWEHPVWASARSAAEMDRVSTVSTDCLITWLHRVPGMVMIGDPHNR